MSKKCCLFFVGLLFLIPAPLSAQNPLFVFPSELSLCGERVPLENQAVWEMVDREFTVVVYDRAQVYLWLKRSERFFPFIEGQLKARGLPDDLKYLLVAESGMRTRAVSGKGASGHWQFMERTGKRFNLRKNAHIDERLDLVKSTEAALSYLKILYGLFGKWTLAMAAYNCGEERVKEEIQQQGENDYFRLDLPQETERYIFRILAAKILLTDPAAYGYELPPGFGYPPEEYDLLTLQLPYSVHLRDLAKACGSYYKEVKELNEELQGYQLPAGLHQIKLPKGKALQCEKKIKDWVKSPKVQQPPAEGDKTADDLF
jgi:membrane-bound lytic murein transglycosylase D